MDPSDFMVKAPKYNLRFDQMLEMQYNDDDDNLEENYDINYNSDQEKSLNVIYEIDEESSLSTQKQDITQNNDININNNNNNNIDNQITDFQFKNTYDAPILFIEDDIYNKKQQKADIKLKTFREQLLEREQIKKQIENKFKNLLREQANYLLQEKKQNQISQKLQKSVNIKFEPAIQEMLQTSQNITESLQVKQKLKVNGMKNSDLEKMERQIDALNLQINQLKTQHNDDQELIKTLKIQVNKMQDSNMTANTSYMSRGSNKSKAAGQLNEENEKLQQEILFLKKNLAEERESFKIKMSRTNMINSSLLQKKQEKQQITHVQSQQQDDSLKNNENNIQKMSQQIAQLRIQITKLNEKIQEQDDLLKKKEKDCNLLLQKQEMNISKLENQINELREQLSDKDEEYKYMEEQMMIDNQINLLFPTQQKQVLRFMNLMVKYEIKEKKIDNVKQLSKNQLQDKQENFNKNKQSLIEQLKLQIIKLEQKNNEAQAKIQNQEIQIKELKTQLNLNRNQNQNYGEM